MLINKTRENFMQGVKSVFLSGMKITALLTLSTFLSVQKCRSTNKFVATTGVEQQTQSNLTPEDDDFIQHRSRSPNHHVSSSRT